MRDTIAQVCELNVIINMHRIVNGNKKILVKNSITITVSQITKKQPPPAQNYLPRYTFQSGSMSLYIIYQTEALQHRLIKYKIIKTKYIPMKQI